jgi:hypothetical protein
MPKEHAMKYLVSWSLPQATYSEALARFLETGAAPPPGVRLIGRWHGMSGRGFAVAESDDASALYLWQAQWRDVLPIEIAPCLDDAEAAQVLSSVRRR